MTWDKKKSGGGIARLSSETPKGGDTIMERPDCRRGDHHKTKKKAAAQHPKPTMRIYMGPGTI